MKDKLVLIGAGGHGKVAADIAKLTGHWNVIQFLDDDPNLKKVNEIDVVGVVSGLRLLVRDHDMFVSIGNAHKRKQITEIIEKYHASIPSLTHPSAIIAKNVKIGRGSMIAAGTVININSTIGKSCIVNTGANIGHDNSIGEYSHVASGCTLAGTVAVGNNTWIGCGSVVSNNINIVSNSIIGAGTVVVKDLEIPGTYVGNPAKFLTTSVPIEKATSHSV